MQGILYCVKDKTPGIATRFQGFDGRGVTASGFLGFLPSQKPDAASEHHGNPAELDHAFPEIAHGEQRADTNSDESPDEECPVATEKHLCQEFSGLYFGADHLHERVGGSGRNGCKQQPFRARDDVGPIQLQIIQHQSARKVGADRCDRKDRKPAEKVLHLSSFQKEALTMNRILLYYKYIVLSIILRCRNRWYSA